MVQRAMLIIEDPFERVLIDFRQSSQIVPLRKNRGEAFPA